MDKPMTDTPCPECEVIVKPEDWERHLCVTYKACDITPAATKEIEELHAEVKRLRIALDARENAGVYDGEDKSHDLD